MFVVIKVLTSALIIGIITEIARRFPTFGGMIAALPLVSLLSLIWLFFQGENSTKLNQFLVGVLWGLPSTVILLVIVLAALKHSIPMYLSILFGAIGWGTWLLLQENLIKRFLF